MAVVTAPLLSFGARGQVGKSQVYSVWKGRPYVRRHVTPANPRSTAQVDTRDVFSFLNSVWKVAPADFRTAWVLAAKGRVMTDRNLFIQKNLPVLKPTANLNALIMSPGAAGGLPGDVTFVAGSGQVTVNGVPPDPLPAGWTVKRLIAAAIRQQDSHAGTLFDIIVGEDLTAPYSIVLAGLAHAQHYMVGGWFEYQKSALATDLAYGPASASDELTT